MTVFPKSFKIRGNSTAKLTGKPLRYLAGIDEAGLGPILGPLVISTTVFEKPQKEGASLWDIGEAAFARRASEPGLAVADSKKIYNKSAGLRRLEEAVLTFIALKGGTPKTFRELLNSLHAPFVPDLEEYPWYAGKDFEIPIKAGREKIQSHAKSATLAFESAGFAFKGVRSIPVEVCRLNRMFDESGNKSQTLFELTAIHLRELWSRFSTAGIEVFTDKHGGRNNYTDLLTSHLEPERVVILAEGGPISSYDVIAGTRRMRIHFAQGGDSTYFPTALASMFSKYVRELHLKLFNEFWTGHDRTLKPTAGYYTDGKRFLQDIFSIRHKASVSDDFLVRKR